MSASQKNRSYKKWNLQSGVVLPVVLIFLVIMMLLGVTAIRNVTLEEKMAGNSRSYQVAFQSAEEALRFCENHIQGTISPKFYAAQTTAVPKVSSTDELPAWSKDNWTATGYSTPVTLKTGSASSGASCMVEPFMISCKSLAISSSIEWCNGYRVTGRGTGPSSETAVLLQSFFILP